LALTINVAHGKDSKNAKPPVEKESSNQPMVPTLPPPTADWPDFPDPDASKPTPEPTADASILPKQESTEPEPVSKTEPSGASLESAPPVSETKEAAFATPAEPTPAQMEPHKRPVPPGYDAAAELYKQKKFPQAAKAFEAIIQKGAANVDTHLSLAYCYLLQRLYSKAVKEFEWVEKYGKNSMTLQKQAGRTAISLRTMISGVCPAPCLKANDPRWHVVNGRRWITIRYSSKSAWNFSDYHVGEFVANENGTPVLKGKCPVCGGTGQVARLKDGDPPPRL